MAEVDVSSYPKANPNGFDPLTNALRFGELQAIINRNKLFPGEQQQQQQQIQQGGQTIQSNQIAIDKQKIDLANQNYQILHGVLGALAGDPKTTREDVIRQGQNLVKQGIIPAPMLAEEIKNMPTDEMIANDPTALPTYLGNVLKTTMDAQGKMNASYGTPGLVNTGGRIVPTLSSPMFGTKIQDRAPSIPLELSPGELSEPMPGPPTPEGEQTVIPKGTFLKATQGGRPMTTTLPAGSVANLEKSAQNWQALRDDVASPNGSAARLFQLNKALTGLKGADTGPGTEWQNNVKSFVTANAPYLGKIAGIDPNKIKDYDEAVKYLTAYASQTAGAMGSDERLASALSANASTHISNLAAQDVVKSNIALERMKQAQASTFNAAMGGQGQKFSDWSVNWNKHIDPRAFVVDMLDQDHRSKMYKNMSDEEKKKFLDSVRIGIASGVINPAAMQASANKVPANGQ